MHVAVTVLVVTANIFVRLMEVLVIVFVDVVVVGGGVTVLVRFAVPLGKVTVDSGPVVIVSTEVVVVVWVTVGVVVILKVTVGVKVVVAWVPTVRYRSIPLNIERLRWVDNSTSLPCKWLTVAVVPKN